MHKLRLWQQHPDWDEAERVWDAGSAEAALKQPVKRLDKLPSMVGITPETARGLKWKSLKWMIRHDREGKIFKGVMRHPFKYGWALIKSVFKKKSYHREGDFFLYGIKSVEEFETLLKEEDNLFVLGFSYCEKPFECPSGRFTDACLHDPEHPVCRQCFIGKAVNALPSKNTFPLFYSHHPLHRGKNI